MFIEIAGYSINTTFIAYVRYFSHEHTHEQRCIITMQNGHEIHVASYDEVQSVREELSNRGQAVIAFDEPPDDHGEMP